MANTYRLTFDKLLDAARTTVAAVVSMLLARVLKLPEYYWAPVSYTHLDVYKRQRIRGGIESAIARGLAYAPYADLIWCETSHPDLEEARQFAEAIHAKHPGKFLALSLIHI